MMMMNDYLRFRCSCCKRLEEEEEEEEEEEALGFSCC